MLGCVCGSVEVGLSRPLMIKYCGLFDLNLTILELIPD